MGILPVQAGEHTHPTIDLIPDLQEGTASNND